MEKRKKRLIVAVLMLIGATAWVSASENYSTPEELLNKSSNLKGQACQVIYKADKSIEINGSIITAEAADNPAERAKGLGGRQCMGENQAMLFVFDEPGQYAFWMKDMKFPIDIIWIGEDKKIVHLEHNISPATFPKIFTNDKPAKYVLELQAGQAVKLDMKQGSQLEF